MAELVFMNKQSRNYVDVPEGKEDEYVMRHAEDFGFNVEKISDEHWELTSRRDPTHVESVYILPF